MAKMPYKHTYRLSLTYFSFRIVLAVVLFSISLIDSHFPLAGNYNSVTFLATVGIYFTLAFGTQLYALTKTQAPSHATLFIAIIIDVSFCLLCMHISGGFGTGIAILLLSPVAIAGIFFYGVFAFFIAAISSLGVLLHIAWSAMQVSDQARYFVPAGLLGILFFATSFATQIIAKHIRRTELLADEQQDLAEKLAQTNLLILQKMQTGILVINEHLKIQNFNASSAQLLGQSVSLNASLPPILQEQLQRWQRDQVQSHASFQVQAGLPMLRASFSYIQQDSENSDIIIFLENQNTLIQQAQHIKLAALGRLSASIAHEIRNPLSTINHASQLLAESTQLPYEDQRLLHMIESQVVRINNIINNVLSISRRTEAKPNKLNLHALCQQVITQFETTLGVKITYESTLEQNVFVPFDKEQLQQVLVNLFDNALRYSFAQTQQYWLKLHCINDDKNCILRLYDKGPGISKNDVDKIFEPFYTTHSQGTGLGLYICRELCEMNQAMLDYLFDEDNQGFFQIRFAHLERQLHFNE